MEETTNTETLSEMEKNPEPEKTTEPVKENSDENLKEKNVGMAIVAYFIFFVPLLTDSKDDPFVKFHVKQGLVLFLGWVAVSFISQITFIAFFAGILNLAILVLLVIGVMNAAGSKKTPLPLVGHLADNFNF